METALTPATISGIFTLFFYALWLVMLVYALKTSNHQTGKLDLLGFTAVIIHGFYLYQNIDGPNGQNLSLINMMSMTQWLALWILLLNAVKRNVTLMLAVMVSCALVTSFVSLTGSSSTPHQLSGQWASLLHIFSAMTATGFLLLAAMQALLVTYADYRLRSHPTHVPGFIPPLQSLESFLFQLLLVGFILMSSALVIAIIFLQDIIAQQPLHKSILSSLAWLTFGGLLLGHQLKGWRGITAAKWTLIGFSLLSLGYFGSKLVIELILNK